MIIKMDSIFMELGVRGNLIFAEIAARFGDSRTMVTVLEEATMQRLNIAKDEPEMDKLTRGAGLAFYNLAKTLDGVGENFHREAAKLSLDYSLQHYDDLGVKITVSGGTLDDLNDYVRNPNSKISLENIELKIN
ncbi:hypothetical protein HOG16_03105 [Candidatus Woesearchaeota archaeon]|nr:hypothetical protein [Candidatus Woesearchaeota archaeon]MBT4322270.1 hypothetical protein [Candidatus Woesearchaeota archaeon]MBT4630887.1 hypothetical protein [Candidatus Woesearchaeota archaeon]